jgi:hypothetical protein
VMKDSVEESVAPEGKKVEDAKAAKTFIVTHDFEAAASRCKAKVKVIAAHCRSQNRRFRYAALNPSVR